MEKILMFRSASEVRLSRVLRFMIPTYLTSLFNTVYTMVDGIFVSAYVGTNALAAINIVYPIVNVLTGIALAAVRLQLCIWAVDGKIRLTVRLRSAC